MIDWSRVNELRDEVGAEDFEEVVELFLEEVQDVIDRLASRPDLGCLEADLHFLKGSALSLGFIAFSDLCQTGESAAAAGQAATVDLTTLIEVYATSRAAFLEQMDQNIAA